jgi:ribosomal protein S18 acetylase RimI-like enzyme
MAGSSDHFVRLATPDDAPAVAQLLHDFAVEDSDPTPGAKWLADRLRRLIDEAHATVLVADADADAEAAAEAAADAGAGPESEPDGVAVLRFRPSIWSDGLECYLAELYVAQGKRGRGIGRALLNAAIDHARVQGADHMELSTSEENAAACALYESLGFSNREGHPERPIQHFYDRDL